MKLSVSLYSFHQYAHDRVSGVKDCIKKAAEIGFEGLDFVEVGLPYEDYLEYARDINKYCKELCITPVCFCTGADFLRCEDIQKEVEKVKRNIDIAKAYGCRIFRHDISSGFPDGRKDSESYDKAIEIIAPAIREITKYAEENGIINTTENHGYFSQDSDRVEKLIRAVNEPNFGALVDIGNFLCADEDTVSAVKRLSPYTRHAHAKDFLYRSQLTEADDPNKGWFGSRGGNHLKGTIVGEGNVPVAQCLASLKENEYDGYLTLEFEGIEDPLYGIEMGYNNLKSILNS